MATSPRSRIESLLDEARAGVARVRPVDLAGELAAGALVVDTRSSELRARDGELPGAVVLERNVLEWRLDPTCPHRLPEADSDDRRIVVVCSEGYSSSLAAANLRRLGLHNATDLEGGFLAWRAVADAERKTTVEEHWEHVHTGVPPSAASWHQDVPAASLRLLATVGADATTPVVDVGGGSSLLVDALVDGGFSDVTVLDVSAAALHRARERLGARAAHVRWERSDVLTWRPERTFGVWHDRAAFHFLVEWGAQEAYLSTLHAALAPGGAVIIATFAPDGPTHCSGLPVVRYSAEDLLHRLGPGFTAVASEREEHHTPAGAVQPFTWLAARRT